MSYPPPAGPSGPWGEQPHQGEQPHWAPQPPYAAPQPPYGQYGPPQHSGNTNVFAILALVFAFVFAPAGIVLGHLAKRQIRQTYEQGEQLATWGLVLSYVFTSLYLLFCCGWFGLVVWAGSTGTAT